MPQNVFALLLVATIYAVLRYAGFGGVSLVHVPAFLANKAIALSAAVAVALASRALARQRPEEHLVWGKASGHLAFVHVLLSLALFSKGNYPAWFDGDRLNLTGETAAVLGVLAAYAWWRAGQTSDWARRRLPSLLGCALLAAHLAVVGFRNWIRPAQWHGGLPPITLLSFMAAAVGLVLFVSAKDERWVGPTEQEPSSRREDGQADAAPPLHHAALASDSGASPPRDG